MLLNIIHCKCDMFTVNSIYYTNFEKIPLIFDDAD